MGIFKFQKYFGIDDLNKIQCVAASHKTGLIDTKAKVYTALCLGNSIA